MSEEVVLLVAIGEPQSNTKDLSGKTESASRPVRDEEFTGSVVPEGGVEPYTYAQSVGSLPPGMSFNAETGEVSGVPTTQGHYEFQIDVTDAESNTFSLVYAMNVEGGIRWDTKELPDAEKSVPYSVQLQVSGGTPPYTFSIVEGSPFANLVLNGPNAGLLSNPNPWTYVVPQLSRFTLRATDAAGRYSDRAFSATLWPQIVWDGPNSHDGLVLLPFEMRQNYRYGMLPLYESRWPAPSFAISAGALPPGLAISPTTGTVYGIPTSPGTYNYTITLTDALGGTISKSMTSRIAAVTDIDQVFEAAFGDGISTEYLISHDLGGNPRSVIVYDGGAGLIAPVEVEWSILDENTISVRTALPPGVDQYSITITG